MFSIQSRLDMFANPIFDTALKSTPQGKAHDTDKIPGHLGQPFSVLLGNGKVFLMRILI